MYFSMLVNTSNYESKCNLKREKKIIKTIISNVL